MIRIGLLENREVRTRERRDRARMQSVGDDRIVTIEHAGSRVGTGSLMEERQVSRRHHDDADYEDKS